MAVKKINKEFLLTDNSVNCYGFRMLTEGMDLEKYKASPIGFRMHKRPDGIVVRWEDFRLDGDKLLAKPSINLANPLGQQTADEVENGFLNAASCGSIVVLEWSEDEALMLPGQTGPTITKWYPKEIALVDIPGNPNATVQLYDAEENEINLADFIHTTLKKQPIGLFKGFSIPQNLQDNMKNRLVSILAVAGVMNLSAQTSDDDILKHVQDLADKAKQVPDLDASIRTLKTDKEKAVNDLNDYKQAQNAARIKQITDAAIEAGKLTAVTAPDLSAKYSDDPEGLQKLVDNLPAYKTVTSQIGAGADVQALVNLSWDELDRSNKLENLKAKDPETFKAKFKERFGSDYKG